MRPLRKARPRQPRAVPRTRLAADPILAQRLQLLDGEGIPVAEGVLPARKDDLPFVVLFEGRAYRAEMASRELCVYRLARQWIGDGTLRRKGEFAP